MKWCTVIFILLTTVSCKETTIDQKAEGEKLMQLSREWAKTASSGDVEKTLSYWADSAVVMSADHPTYQGKQAIRQMVEESFKIPGFNINWQPKQVVVSKAGDMAYLIENSQISFKDSIGKTITLHNKTVSIWHKQGDGNWKNVVDISTPDAK